MQDELKIPIYLDHQATTPVDKRVLQAMEPYFLQIFGNPASKNHSLGKDALHAVEDSRRVIAKAINAKPQDICFTSGATEAVNLAIKGLFYTNRWKKQHYITAATEHKAVLDSFKRIEYEGVEVSYLRVDSQGMIDPNDVAESIRSDTIMVSIMAANNEIGVLQPLKEIGIICRERKVLFMTDATQALGKIPLDVQEMNLDLLACSAHKIYGPKGIGALFCRRSMPAVKLTPIIDGGGHERGLRSGTLNVPGIVGLAKAIEIATKEMIKEGIRLQKLRDCLYALLEEGIPGIRINGHQKYRLQGNLNVCIPGVESEALIIALSEEIALSTGSACTSASIEPSHVLKALGLTDRESHSSIRFGLGRLTTSSEITYTAKRVVNEVNRLRALAGNFV